MTESTGGERNLAMEEITSTTKQAQEEEKAKAQEKQEQLCELSRALAVLASASVRKTFFLFLPTI